MSPQNPNNLNARLLAGWLALAGAGIACGQATPTPLQTPSPWPAGLIGTPEQLTAAAGNLYFVAAQEGTGQELWCTDGSAAGTRMVKNIFPGRGSSSPHRLLAHGSGIYFLASDPVHGCEWWTSDGTAEGTRLVADLTEGRGSTNASAAIVIGNKLWFFIPSPTEEGSSDLWVSDGTDVGTQAVAAGLGNPGTLVGEGDQLFFFRGSALWRSDGTLACTIELMNVSPWDSPSSMTMVGNTLFFTVRSPWPSLFTRLWKSDGTPQETVILREFSKDQSGSSFATDLTAVDGKLAFVASDSLSGAELWTSDGTTAGTVMAVDLKPGPQNSGLDIIGNLGSSLYLKTPEGLWISDGTRAGTLPLLGSSGRWWGDSMASGDSVAYIDVISPVDLIRNDGTPGGSTPLPAVKATLGKKESREALVSSGDDLYFLNRTPQKSCELWFLPAAASKPVLVKTFADREWLDTSFEEWSVPETAVIGEKVLFSASDRHSIWSSDGTVKGTRLASRIKGTVMTGGYYEPENFQVHHGRLYFAAQLDERSYQVSWTDGTPRGSGQSKVMKFFPDLNRSLLLRAGLGNSYFFAPLEDNPADDLRFTQTGLKGERRVKAGQGSAVLPAGALVFAYDDNQLDGSEYQASQLWVCDGSRGGTKPLDLGPSFEGPVRVHGKLGDLTFFTAFHTEQGMGLWVTGGTVASTRQVLELSPAADPNARSYVIDFAGFTVYQGEAFFLLRSGSLDGIWRSDGTEAGTRRIKELDDTPYYDPYYNRTTPVELDGILYFTARSEAGGPELWKSDGTTEGTMQAVDILPGHMGSNPQDLIAGGSLIYFSADDGRYGRELWQSDGTPAGTRMVGDLTDGDGLSSNPVGLSRTTQKLFFLAGLPGTGDGKILHVMDIE